MNRLRRRLLHWGVAAPACAVAAASSRAAAPAFAAAPAPAAAPPLGESASSTTPVRRLSLRNLHTSEKLDVVFFRGTDYVPDALAAIQALLRDYRTGEQHPMDPKLMDYLYDVARRLGKDPVFSVISGYRSPQTNERLRERSEGVARHSLHLEGRAIDVRLAGADCADLAARARDMSRGGVGYYRRSDFVHLDTGAYRTWNG